MPVHRWLVGTICVVPCVLAVGCGARTPLEVGSELVDAGAVGCIPGRIVLTRANPVVMFVLDRSQSMDTLMEGTSSGQNRWEALASALGSALPPVDPSVQIGALLFPAGSSRETASCSMSTQADLVPRTGNVSALAGLMARTSPGGATPTALAIDTAATLMLGVRAATAARALVLATDGAPDCNANLDPSTCRCVSSSSDDCRSATRCLDDARTVQRIATYRSQELPSYVIGIQSEGDDEFSDVLDAMADAGGRAQTGAPQRYYAARSATELGAALVAIRDQVGVCTYLTSSVPDQNGSITLTLDGAPLSAEQWNWGSLRDGEIILLGNACRTAAAEQDPELVADVECADS